MRVLFTLFLLAFALGVEYVVDQAYVDYLKAHVTWQVTDYEDNIFRGWTIDEIKEILTPEEMIDMDMDIPSEPYLITDDSEPKEIDWSKDSSDCTHGVRNQGSCDSSWAFAAADMVADRCCLRVKDPGFLSPQELVSCDKSNRGCYGGVMANAIDYVVRNGLVREACYPYIAKEDVCPTRCKDGSNWAPAHVCKCSMTINCIGEAQMIKCLESGPIITTLDVYRSLMSYDGGIYRCNNQGYVIGLQTVRCVGYGTSPEKHWKCINSWGTGWGSKGYLYIAVGHCAVGSRGSAYCDPIAN